MKLRRIFGVLFALCLAVGVMALSASAETVASGEFGRNVDNLIWKLDDMGTLTISGERYMDDFSDSAAPWYDYRDDIYAVNINEGVWNIGAYAFCECSNLKSITISDSVTSIEDFAFSDCYSLESIIIPNGVTSIGMGAFSACQDLASITIPDGVQRIEDEAFYNCSSLERITIPGSVTSIGYYVFCECDELVILFAGDAPEINSTAFGGSKGVVAYYPMNNETWSDVVKQNYDGEITWEAVCSGKHTWLDATCTEPKHCTRCSITEGNALGHDIKKYAAQEPTCTKYSWEAYEACTRCNYTTCVVKAPLGHVIEEHAAKERSCTESGWDAYETCTRCDYTTYKEVAALGHAIEKHTAKAPTYTEVGWEAYEACTRCNYTTYKEIAALGHVAEENVRYSGFCGAGEDQVFYTLYKDGTLVIFGEGKMKDYRYNRDNSDERPSWERNSGFNWVEKVIVEDGVTYIGKDTFRDRYSSLEEVVLADSVVSIGSNAFSYSDVAKLTLSKNLEIIDEKAFQGCSNLESVTFYEGVQIGKSAFGSCSGLTDILFAEPVKEIKESAFAGCTGLTEIKVNCSYMIGNYAFAGCSNLKKISFAEGLRFICEDVFRDCSELTVENLPDSLEWVSTRAFFKCNFPKGTTLPTGLGSIGSYAFASTNLETVEITDPTVSIGDYAFSGTAIKEVVVPNVEDYVVNEGDGPGDVVWRRRMGNYVFSYCPALTSATIADGTAYIADGMFYGCKNLTEITIPDSITEIGSHAFDSCVKLTEVAIPNGVTTIYDYAFDQCTGLKEITIPKSVKSLYRYAFSETGIRYVFFEGDPPAYVDSNVFFKSWPVIVFPKENSAWGEKVKLGWSSSIGDCWQTDCMGYVGAVCVPYTPLKITVQPKTVYVQNGKTAQVELTADGVSSLAIDDKPLKYEWYYKDAGMTKFAKSSVTTEVYSTTMNSTRKNREVYCVVTDIFGKSLQSKTVYLRMAASITTQPKDTCVADGETAKLTLKAAGDGLKYTWYFKNKGSSKFTKSSATSTTYSTKMSSTTNGRQVYCVVKDKYGKSVKSAVVTLSTPVKITTQPKTTYTQSGSTAKVTVKAVGDGLKYTWYYKNAGASKFTKASTTTSTYSAKMSSTTKNRQVYCIVKDKYGKSVQTSTVYLRMAASITTQPKTTYTKSGSSAKVTVKAAGDGLKYTWYYKNKGASKFTKATATASTYSVKMSSTVKDRQVYCVVKDKYGKTAKTDTVTLRMAASITTQPKTVTVKKNATAKVTVKAAGDGLKYTWYYKNKGSSKFTKATGTTSTYSVKMTSKVNGRQVYCVVKDKYGKTVKSSTATLKMK